MASHLGGEINMFPVFSELHVFVCLPEKKELFLLFLTEVLVCCEA